jgi:hypothetical protein
MRVGFALKFRKSPPSESARLGLILVPHDEMGLQFTADEFILLTGLAIDSSSVTRQPASPSRWMAQTDTMFVRCTCTPRPLLRSVVKAGRLAEAA